MQNKAEKYDFMGLRSKIGVCGEKNPSSRTTGNSSSV